MLLERGIYLTTKLALAHQVRSLEKYYQPKTQVSDLIFAFGSKVFEEDKQHHLHETNFLTHSLLGV